MVLIFPQVSIVFTLSSSE